MDRSFRDIGGCAFTFSAMCRHAVCGASTVRNNIYICSLKHAHFRPLGGWRKHVSCCVRCHTL